jgi:hypothetical protein
MPEMLTSQLGVQLASEYARSALPDAPVVTPPPQRSTARRIRAHLAAGLRLGARLENRLADRLDQPVVDPDAR